MAWKDDFMLAVGTEKALPIIETYKNKAAITAAIESGEITNAQLSEDREALAKALDIFGLELAEDDVTAKEEGIRDPGGNSPTAEPTVAEPVDVVADVPMGVDIQNEMSDPISIEWTLNGQPRTTKIRGLSVLRGIDPVIQQSPHYRDLLINKAVKPVGSSPMAQ